MPDASGKLNDSAGTVKSYIFVEPNNQTDEQVEVEDVPRTSGGIMDAMPDRSRAFALITLPEKVTAKLEKIFDILPYSSLILQQHI